MQKNNSASFPIVGVTLGDPSGIGPEIVCKAFSHHEIFAWCRPVIIGSLVTVTQEATKQKLNFDFVTVKDISLIHCPNQIEIYDVPFKGSQEIKKGEISALAGKAAYSFVIKAIELVHAGKIDAITTGPLTKESIQLAGLPHIDHTEILSANSKGNAVTLLATRQLRVAHVMRHWSLAESIKRLSTDLIFKTIVDTAKGMKCTLGISNAKLIVAGLNPHNGDGGIMGNEEERIVLPAIIKAQKAGYNAIGPIAADSAFPQAILGECDAVIALYHDQGHIAVKVNDWRKSYTVTIGLDNIRTSPNHGSALDIAGKCVADEYSLLEAIYQATIIAKQHKGKKR